MITFIHERTQGTGPNRVPQPHVSNPDYKAQLFFLMFKKR